MLTDLLATTLNTTTDIIEGLILAIIGVKPSRRTRKQSTRRYHSKKRTNRKLVLNERAQLRLAGKLFENLPRDVAISVFNDIKRFGMEV